MNSVVFASKTEAETYLRTHHPEIKSIPVGCKDHAFLIGSVTKHIADWDPAEASRRCVYSVHRGKWFRLTMDEKTGKVYEGEEVHQDDLRPIAAAVPEAEADANVPEGFAPTGPNGLLVPENTNEISTIQAKKAACYAVYEHFNAETMEYMQMVKKMNVPHPSFVEVGHMNVSFEFFAAAKPAERTQNMKVTSGAALLDIPVLPDHVLLVMVDLNGIKTSAGKTHEHPHSCLLVRTHDGAFMIESNSSSAAAIARAVYDTTLLAEVLRVPTPHILLNNSQSESKMDICNAFASLAMVLVMVNWKRGSSGASVCAHVNAFLDSLTGQTAKQMFVWLMRDYST